jgi:hypothetical protein
MVDRTGAIRQRRYMAALKAKATGISKPDLDQYQQALHKIGVCAGAAYATPDPERTKKYLLEVLEIVDKMLKLI